MMWQIALALSFEENLYFFNIIMYIKKENGAIEQKVQKMVVGTQ